MKLSKGLLLIFGFFAAVANAEEPTTGSTILSILQSAKSVLIPGGIFAAGWGAWKIFISNDNAGPLEWIALIVGSSLVGAYDTIAGFVSGLFTTTATTTTVP